jgi:hypothetical protein
VTSRSSAPPPPKCHLRSGALARTEHLARAVALTTLAFTSGCRGCSPGEVDVPNPDATTESAPERLTLAQLLSAPETYAGHRIRVAGEPRPGEVQAVTALPCPPAKPCCNSCTSGYSLDGRLPLTGQPSGTFGCAGDSCECAQTCTPFPAKEAGVWAFVGTVEVTSLGPRLRVESWTRQDPR